MIQITRAQRKLLDSVGLLKYKRNGWHSQDQNFVVVNKDHMSKDKGYYVAELPEILAFLGYYDNLNLQKISEEQYNELVEAKLLTESNMQKWKTYVPNAVAFEDKEGQWRIKKVANLMLFLGIWKSKKN